MYQKKHYTTQAKELGQEITAALKDEPNIDLMWSIVKFGKLIRRSCRGNTAFNNAMNAAFPNATFTQDGREYKPGKFGLKIRLKANPEISRTEDEGDDEE